ncbi:monovalent cation/H(+) antiporter subunit G [Haloferula sp. A504]|uniref:monovalent cation/H(+) antiporter subunit G n=1 Tax=Haloferula sp. A504 TaxID=3373601 RepID=UPI0031C601AC|nr:monovalent cation/H(+) antiporter subunit G [Verrucomicrobiaceae bacterium E54]
MSGILDIVGYGLVVLGLAFMLVGSVGIVRLPDFFARTHAASKVDTVGVSIVVVGVACIEGFSLDGLKVLLAAFFVVMTNPVAAHALARAAALTGLRPWVRPDTADSAREKSDP